MWLKESLGEWTLDPSANETNSLFAEAAAISATFLRRPSESSRALSDNEAELRSQDKGTDRQRTIQQVRLCLRHIATISK